MANMHFKTLGFMLIVFLSVGLVTEGARHPIRQSQTSPGVRGEKRRALKAKVSAGFGEDDEVVSLYEQVMEHYDFCTSTLLSEEMTDDGSIDQDDFSEMLQMFCDEFDASTVAGYTCPKNAKSTAFELKRIFAQGLCGGEDTQLSCLASLEDISELVENYAITVAASTAWRSVEKKVDEICVDVFPYENFRPPTSYPTREPSSRPTATPTASPSASPTVSPSLAPSSTLSTNPSSVPTESPVDVSAIENTEQSVPGIEIGPDSGTSISAGAAVGIAMGALAVFGFVFGGIFGSRASRAN